MNIEIERKFLVKDESFKSMATESHRLTQGYICKESGRTVRVRLWDDKGYLTIKGAGSASGMSRYEWEKEISAEDARDLFMLCQSGIIDKTRYIVPVDGKTFEVDEFYGENAGLVMARPPLLQLHAFRPPVLGMEARLQLTAFSARSVVSPEVSVRERQALKLHLFSVFLNK